MVIIFFLKTILLMSFTLLQGQEDSSKERSVSPHSVGKNTDATEADQDKESVVRAASLVRA